MIELAVSLAVVLLLGAGLDRALFPAHACGWIERLGRAIAFGFAGYGALSMLLDALGIRVGPLSLGVALLLAGGVLATAVARSPARPRAAMPRPANGLQWAALAAVAALAIVSLVLVVRSGWLRPTFQFDAITRWMFKTKVLALEGTLRGAISTDPGLWFTHQQYPPLVAHVAALPAFVGELSGKSFDDRVASAIYPFYAVGLVALAYGAVARRAGALTGGVAACWIATLPLLAYIAGPPPGAGAFSALADIPLSLFVLGAGLAALDAIAGRPRAVLETGLLLGACALTKNEGLPFVLALSLAMLLLAPRGVRGLSALAPAAIALALFAALWGWLAAGFPALDENYWGRMHGDAVQQGLRRVPMIAAAFFHGMTSFREWNVTWLAVLALLVVGWPALRRSPGLRILVLAVLLQLGAYAFAYLVTGWTSPRAEASMTKGDPLEVLFQLTLGRLLMHVAPLAIVAAVLAVPLGDATRPEERSAGLVGSG